MRTVFTEKSHQTGKIVTDTPRLALLSSGINDQTGWGRYTREFCLALYRRDVPFELHLPRTASITESLPFKTQVRQDLPSPFLSFGKRWWRLGCLWRAAYNLQIQGELIHSLVEFPYGLLAQWLSRRHSLPFGFTAYGTYAVEPFDRWFDRLWFQRVVQEADFIGAVSQYTSERLRQVAGIQRPIAVIHGAVDVERFPYGTEADQRHARQALGIDPQAKVVLCVGAMKARKGIDVLLEAFALVRQVESRAHLLLIGSGSDKSYQRLATKLEIQKATCFLGPVDHERLVRYYHACDVFALLPRETHQASNFEGFGLVYLEANACGRPVVGARSGGVPDAIQAGQTGLLVEPEDPGSAAQAILRLLCDPALARRLGDQGRAWAENHSWDRIVEAYLKLYRSVDFHRQR